MLPTDAFFWYAAEAAPELRPLVAGLFALDRVPDRKGFHASVLQLLAHMPRLRQRVVDAPLRWGLPQWEDDEHFELQYHMREVALPEPGSQQQLLDFVSTVFEAPLDPMRPLWEGYLIEGLEGARAAFFLKVHHSIMDGVGAVALFDVFTQAKRDARVRAARRPSARRRGPTPVPALGAARDALSTAINGLGGALRGALHTVQDPGGALDEALRVAGSLQRIAGDFAASATKDPLAARCTGIGRRVEYTSFSLPRLRHLKEHLAVSLNDVLLTAVAGAVGRYHAHRGLAVNELQCMVPMNIRETHERHLPGNRVGVFRVTLPVGERDPLLRLDMIREQTSIAKRQRNGGGGAYPFLMQAVTLIPAVVFRRLAELASGRVGLICSNVPGPPATRYLAGARIDAVYPFAPVLLGIPLSIALVSYGDIVCVGLDADPGAIPDPGLLRRYLEEAVGELEGHHVSPAAPAARPPRGAPRHDAVRS